jgi:hypothetical protein
LRITLGQLPDDARESVRNLKVFGADELAEELYEQVRPRAEALGLRAQLVKEFAPLEFGVALPGQTAASAALALVMRHVTGKSAGWEFLPPRVSRWQQFAAQQGARKIVYVAAVLGLAALATAGMFIWQQLQLNELNQRWDGMKTRVAQIDDMNAKIRKYRPWFDESFRTLTILKKLTEAFPEDGSAAVKSIEIRDRSGVTCTGTVRNNDAWLKVQDRLRNSRQITDVELKYLKGGQNGQPKELSFTFRWVDNLASK